MLQEIKELVTFFELMMLSSIKATYLAEISVDHDGTAIGPGSTLDYV